MHVQCCIYQVCKFIMYKKCKCVCCCCLLSLIARICNLQYLLFTSNYKQNCIALCNGAPVKQQFLLLLITPARNDDSFAFFKIHVGNIWSLFIIIYQRYELSWGNFQHRDILYVVCQHFPHRCCITTHRSNQLTLHE